MQFKKAAQTVFDGVASRRPAALYAHALSYDIGRAAPSRTLPKSRTSS